MSIFSTVRKVSTLGALAVFVGSSIGPASIVSASVVSRDTDTIVGNPGNLIKDGSEYYDTFEWFQCPTMPSDAAFESAHTTFGQKFSEDLTNGPHTTFELRNDTDHTVQFFPAADLAAYDDDVWHVNIKDRLKWGNMIPVDGGTKVPPFSTKSVTTTNARFSGLKNARSFYMYVQGPNGKNMSTNGLSYRIYQGDAQPYTKYLPYKLMNDTWSYGDDGKTHPTPTEANRNYLVPDSLGKLKDIIAIPFEYFNSQINLGTIDSHYHRWTEAINTSTNNFKFGSLSLMTPADPTKKFSVYEDPNDGKVYILFKLNDVIPTNNAASIIVNFKHFGINDLFEKEQSIRIPIKY